MWFNVFITFVIFYSFSIFAYFLNFLPSVPWHCWLSNRKCIQPVKDSVSTVPIRLSFGDAYLSVTGHVLVKTETACFSSKTGWFFSVHFAENKKMDKVKTCHFVLSFMHTPFLVLAQMRKILKFKFKNLTEICSTEWVCHVSRSRGRHWQLCVRALLALMHSCEGEGGVHHASTGRNRTSDDSNADEKHSGGCTSWYQVRRRWLIISPTAMLLKTARSTDVILNGDRAYSQSSIWNSLRSQAGYSSKSWSLKADSGSGVILGWGRELHFHRL